MVRLQITDNKIFLCDRCLNYFYFKEKLKIQKEICKYKKAVAATVSKKSDVIQFKNYVRKKPPPFGIHADFQCLLPKNRHMCTRSN